MRSYIIRHWHGAVGAWWSLLATVVAYVVATAAVVGAGSMFGGTLSRMPNSLLIIALWSVIVVAAAVGTLRSALFALRNWRSRRVNALGGIIAIVILGLAAFGAVDDLRTLSLKP